MEQSTGIGGAIRRKRKRLGELLMASGLLSEDVLARALREQKQKGLRLGEWLVQNDILTEDQIVQAVSRQLNLDIYSPEKYRTDPGLAEAIPREVALQRHVAPLCRKGNVLFLALLDPTDMQTLDAVMELSRLDIEPVLCRTSDLKAIQQELYGDRTGADNEELLDSLQNLDIPSETEPDADVGQNPDSYLITVAENAPVVRLANSILVQAMSRGASDIHLSPEKDDFRLRFRIDGELVEVVAPPKSVFLPLLSRLKLLARMDISVSRVPQDGRFTFLVNGREVHVRASTLPTIHGEKMVLRLFDQTSGTLPLDKLGMRRQDQDKLEWAIGRPHGLILATGPTGSGKTTLLYSLLQRIYRPNISVVTLEDPVEYIMAGITQVQLNRKAGMTFASGLRSILRQDPDVIMVGEIRDVETATVATESSLTGHLVLSTLHTNNAVGAVTRLLEMGIEPFLITSTLRVVVAQRLLRRLCPACRVPYQPSAQVRRTLGLAEADGPATLYRPKGCEACNHTGYKGRIGVFEVLEIDERIEELTLRRASTMEIQQYTEESGKMTTLAKDAALKVLEGTTSFEEFIAVYTTH